MAINFPDAQSTGDEFTSGDRTWKWDGTTWESLAAGLTATLPVVLTDLDISLANLEVTDITDLTATAAELNILDGVTADAAELNILDGVTATSAELNILDGVIATTAEINILDGVTADATELNYVDGVTSGIQSQLDARVLETNGAVTTASTSSNVVRNITLSTSEPSSGSDGDVWLVYEA